MFFPSINSLPAFFSFLSLQEMQVTGRDKNVISITFTVNRIPFDSENVSDADRKKNLRGLSCLFSRGFRSFPCRFRFCHVLVLCEC